MMTLILPVILGGCPTGTKYPDDPYYPQSMTRAQIEQTKIQMKQQQKISQKNQSQTINIYNKNQPYSGYPEMVNNADRLAEARANRRAYERRMEEARQREQAPQDSYAAARADQAPRQGIGAQEARDIEQARLNSYATAREEEARRKRVAAQEARDIEQARQNSNVTARAEEARQTEQARQESLRTFAEEQAKRQQAAVVAQAASSVAPPPPPPAPEAQAIPNAASKWKPSENDLIQAGNKVMELKNKNEGRIPTHGEMSSHIQANMGLNPEQADKVLRKLGV
jgi:hypothetical protein